MGQEIEDIGNGQACPLDDGLSHHDLRMECNTLKKLLVLHSFGCLASFYSASSAPVPALGFLALLSHGLCSGGHCLAVSSAYKFFLVLTL